MNFGGWFTPPAPKTPGEAALKQSGAADAEKKGSEGTPYTGSGFDPTGLERAAKASKILDASPNAKASLDVIQEQERSKQMEHALKVAEYETYKAQLKMQQLSEKYKEDTQYLKRQTEEQKRLAEHSNEMDKRRELEKMRQQEAMHQKQLQDQLGLFKRQEEMRRKTIEKEASLRMDTEMKKVQAEVAGRIKQEQDNHDLRLEQARVQGAEDRQTALESIKLAGETMGQGLREFLSDQQKMAAAASTITLVALGVYSAKVSTGLVGRYVEARLGKPSLVRETSRTNALTVARHPLRFASKLIKGTQAENALSGVVLEPGLEERLKRVASSTANTKRNRAPFRHLLLYGPPGTGKTLFAKNLAKHSGLEYAILTGGDVAPLGRDAVTEIHKVFNWAEASKKGLLLFIDESDAFLRKRSTESMSEDLRNALNAFLYRTGEPTNKFMVVYASNQPEQFDWAINDRIDEMVEFDLPGLEERERMLNLYVSKYLKGAEGATKITLDPSVGPEMIRSVAERTEGFSGREIAKLAIAWQAAAYGSPDATFTPGLVETVLTAHADQKLRKQLWNAPQPGLAYRK